MPQLATWKSARAAKESAEQLFEFGPSYLSAQSYVTIGHAAGVALLGCRPILCPCLGCRGGGTTSRRRGDAVGPDPLLR